MCYNARLFFGFAARFAIAAATSVSLLSTARAEDAKQVTFARDVAPIFMERCVVCHRAGEVAPMSLMTYEEARPWAKSIQKKVAAGEMPPWRIDESFGTFANTMRVSEEDKALISAWVDQGAPMGNPEDMPPAPEFPDGWIHGEPDYVVELPEQAVPAEGEDLFPNRVAVAEFDQERWVSAIEFLPGNKKVVHHILAFLGEFGMQDASEAANQERSNQTEIFSVWVAGSQPTVYPEGAGRILRKRQVMTFNMHYHPYGEATTDVTRIGLHFGEGDIEKSISTAFAVNTGFVIPPGAPNHEVHAFMEFDQDSRIISFLPHMHVRGKDMTYRAVYPDGRAETLLSVPQYDYNWQWIYYPEEHVKVPAGTRIEVVAHYDNSEGNAANPDPNAKVYYRDETFQEMLVAFMEYIPEEGVKPQSKPPIPKLEGLLSRHPSEDGYRLDGLFGLPWAAYLPRESDKEPIWYLALGGLMFTNSVWDLKWEGDHFSFESTMVSQGGGGISMAVDGTVSSNGQVSGEITIGHMEAAADPDNDPAVKMPFKGHRIEKTARALGNRQVAHEEDCDEIVRSIVKGLQEALRGEFAKESILDILNEDDPPPSTY